MNAKDRLLEFLKYLNIGQGAFEKKVGISNGYISKIKESIGSNHINKISSIYPELNITWLLNGEGEMLNTSSGDSSNDKNLPYTVTKSGIEYYKFGDTKFMMKVPFVPIQAYARYVDEYRDADTYEGPDYFYFPVDQVFHGKYRAFEIKGDSMDNDTKKSLSNGDVVLGRDLGCDLWKSPLHINDYPNWIIVLDNTIICKQIIKHNIGNGEIICHSLNSDPAYADFSLNLNEVRELYNIVMVTRTF